MKHIPTLCISGRFNATVTTAGVMSTLPMLCVKDNKKIILFLFLMPVYVLFTATSYLPRPHPSVIILGIQFWLPQYTGRSLTDPILNRPTVSYYFAVLNNILCRSNMRNIYSFLFPYFYFPVYGCSGYHSSPHHRPLLR